MLLVEVPVRPVCAACLMPWGFRRQGGESPMLGAVNLISPERMKANQPVLVLVLWISGKELK